MPEVKYTIKHTLKSLQNFIQKKIIRFLVQAFRFQHFDPRDQLKTSLLMLLIYVTFRAQIFVISRGVAERCTQYFWSIGRSITQLFWINFCVMVFHSNFALGLLASLLTNLLLSLLITTIPIPILWMLVFLTAQYYLPHYYSFATITFFLPLFVIFTVTPMTVLSRRSC